MNSERLNDLVGKSFEDLTVEEMRELQGAGSVEVESTPTPAIVYTVGSAAASAALSGAISKAVSTIVTYTRKCE